MALFAGEGGDIFRSQVMFENLEIQKGGTIAWDMHAYAGYNKNKLYLFSEGEGSSQCHFLKLQKPIKSCLRFNINSIY